MKALLFLALGVFATSIAAVNFAKTPDGGNLGMIGAALGIGLALTAGVWKLLSVL